MRGSRSPLSPGCRQRMHEGGRRKPARTANEKGPEISGPSVLRISALAGGLVGGLRRLRRGRLSGSLAAAFACRTLAFGFGGLFRRRRRGYNDLGFLLEICKQLVNGVIGRLGPQLALHFLK